MLPVCRRHGGFRLAAHRESTLSDARKIGNSDAKSQVSRSKQDNAPSGRSALNISDAECVERCARNDVSALGILVERYEQPLRAVLLARRIRHDLIDDVIQESFLRAFAAAVRKSAAESFFPWLVGIAVRVALELGRSLNVRRRSPVNDGIAQHAAAGSEAREAGEVLLFAVEGLPEPFRTTLMLRYFGSFSCAQIADYMSAPIGTVTKRISRAMYLLRGTLVPSSNQHEVQP